MSWKVNEYNYVILTDNGNSANVSNNVPGLSAPFTLHAVVVSGSDSMVLTPKNGLSKSALIDSMAGAYGVMTTGGNSYVLIRPDDYFDDYSFALVDDGGPNWYRGVIGIGDQNVSNMTVELYSKSSITAVALNVLPSGQTQVNIKPSTGSAVLKVRFTGCNGTLTKMVYIRGPYGPPVYI